MKKFNNMHTNRSYIPYKPDIIKKQYKCKYVNHRKNSNHLINLHNNYNTSFLTPNGWAFEISPALDENIWLNERKFSYNNTKYTNISFLTKYKKFYTTKYENKQLVNVYLRNKINCHERDMYGRTHLMYVCMHSLGDNKLSMVKLLLKQGSGINICDSYGDTTLKYALNYVGNIKIIKLLVKHTISYHLNKVLLFWSETAYLPDIRVANILLNAGASINITCNQSSILLNIMRNKNYHDITDIVHFLLINKITLDKYASKNNSDIFIQWSDNNVKPYTLFDYVLMRYNNNNNNKKLISLLLNYGCDYKSTTIDMVPDDYIKNIINTMEYSKSFFKTNKILIQESYYQMIYKPGNLRFKIIKMSWDLRNNIKINYDSDILQYFGINDTEKLDKIISETYHFINYDINYDINHA
ncbi:ankyrin repeat protein [Megavirus baoshan]|uniref:Ankyrin repeat protein n=1 Tax=Megavirus baoshan TaxID=2496520 RepID=A0A8K1W7E1_9VIRU|nr:ankyrin repeat protein [Megavirus baoshan]UFX99730.1 ankyrin repeat protein [Megavirus baoshan]